MGTHFANAARLVVLCVILPAHAVAQTRTPTSPLDQPETTDARPSAPVVEAPRVAPETVRPGVRLSLPRVEHAAVREDVSLDRLLPEGVSTSRGWTPDAVVSRVASRSLTVRRAHARTVASDATIRLARRAFVPRITTSLRYTRLSDYTPGSIRSFDTAGCLTNVADCTANPDAYQSDVVLQQPILNQYAFTTNASASITDYLGAARFELRAAHIDRDAAGATERAALEDSVLVGLSTYFELVRARAQHRLADDAALAAERRASDVREQVARGTSTEAARLEAEASARSYAQLRTVAQSRVVIAEHALRDLLELDDADPVALSVELTSLPAPDTRDEAALRAIAEAHDPVARASTLRAEAESTRALAERARMLPTLSLAFNVTQANPNQRIFPQTTTFTATWDLGVSLSFSLDGTLLASARRSQRLAIAEENALAAEEETRRAGRDAIEARAALDASLAELEQRRIATAAAEIREHDVTARRTAGLATEADLLDASAGALRARLDLVDAVVDAHLARAQLTRALGSASIP